MSNTNPPTRRDFLEFALERFEFEYAELIDAWKQVDIKAQVAATICGVLLAAIFAFVRIMSSPAPLSLKLLIGLSVALTVGTIGLAVRVLLLRQTFIPVTGNWAAQAVEHVFALPEVELEPRYEALLGDAINNWSSVNKRLRVDLQTKTGQLRHAHISLLSCAVTVVLTTLITLTLI